MKKLNLLETIVISSLTAVAAQATITAIKYKKRAHMMEELLDFTMESAIHERMANILLGEVCEECSECGECKECSECSCMTEEDFEEMETIRQKEMETIRQKEYEDKAEVERAYQEAIQRQAVMTCPECEGTGCEYCASGSGATSINCGESLHCMSGIDRVSGDF